MNTLVLPDQNAARERFSTHKATKGLFTGVGTLVLVQCVPFDKGATAHIAFVWLFDLLSVTLHVGVENAFGEKRLGAQLALGRLGAFVIAPVLVEFAARVKLFVANGADAWISAGVCVDVSIKFSAIGRAESAYVAGKLGSTGRGFLPSKNTVALLFVSMHNIINI